jgi:predicted amidohydrolase YtcJ
MCIHVIEDRAVDIALNTIDEALRRKDCEDNRHRIERADLV